MYQLAKWCVLAKVCAESRQCVEVWPDDQII